jgi:hypothetical protein
MTSYHKNRNYIYNINAIALKYFIRLQFPILPFIQSFIFVFSFIFKIFLIEISIRIVGCKDDVHTICHETDVAVRELK